MSAAATDTPAVRIVDLSKTYADGTRALDHLSLEIPAGSFFGLLGPNGAGKSTLIRSLCGLVRVSEPGARIEVFGHDARRGGYFGMTRAQAREKADELIDAFDLDAKVDTRAPRLSGGMKRRLLLARAFLHDPPLLVLDEPTAGVDVELRMELHAYIRRLHASGRTILLTTHYLEEAEALCDDLALVRDGRVAMRGTPTDLKAEHGAATVEDLYLQVNHR